ncbi:MAG: DUF465 domain-containing protein, partial [Gammaproteobacteria bacterium]|nr:DUF465 domain-containing protein [Gammaproteobacteria bacterium]
MFGEHHSLSEEFPEYKERIHELKINDRHFVKLLHEYEEIAKEVYRIEEGMETPSDEYTEELKKKRL